MENKMGTKPIPGLILGMSLPVIFSMLVQALYNVVDSMFVSQIGEDALASVSLAFPLQMLVVAAFVGLSTGVSSNISRKLGAKEHEAAAQIADHGVFLAVILYVLVACIGLGLTFFFFDGFTDNQNIINGASDYTRIVMLFSFGIIMSHSATGILQGTGDMVKPMFAQLIGAITNIILDPILIFGYFGLPALGIRGAAIATVVAQILAMIFVWIVLKEGKSIIKPRIREFKYDSHIIKQILLVGVPTAIMQGLGSIMLTGMNLILSAFGDSAIALMGVYFRVQSMVLMPVFGLAIGTMPVVGYNFGAKNKSRITQGIRFSIIVAVVFMTVCFGIFQTVPSSLIGIFNPTEKMLEIGIPAFKRISLVFPIFGATIILSTSFQAFGKAYYSLIISGVRQLGVLLPVAYVLSRFGNIDVVWFAFIVAEGVGVLFAITLFYKVYHQATRDWIKE